MKNSMDILDVTMDIPSLDDTMPDNERFVRAVKKSYRCVESEASISGLTKLPEYFGE